MDPLFKYESETSLTSERPATGTPQNAIPILITRHLHYGKPHTPGGPPTIPKMVTAHPYDGHLASVGLSDTIPAVVNHTPPDGQQPSPGQSAIILRMVSNNPQDSHHHSQDGHLVSPEWSTMMVNPTLSLTLAQPCMFLARACGVPAVVVRAVSFRR